MSSLSRRKFIKIISIGISTFIIPCYRTGAADKAAVLVAQHGKIGKSFEGLNGINVCGGSKVSDPNSEYSKRLRQLGATVINIPFSERYMALQTGVCGALIFIADGKTKKQLEEEIKVFMPQLSQYEFSDFPTDQ